MPVQDLSTQFDADWQKAQERYDSYGNIANTDVGRNFIASAKAEARAKAENRTIGIVRGKAKSDYIDQAVAEAEKQAQSELETRSAADANQIYLAPVRAKWNIIKMSPQTFQDKTKMAKISSDFETATASSQKDAFDRSNNGAVGDNISPLVLKWMTEVAADKADGKVSTMSNPIETTPKLTANDYVTISTKDATGSTVTEHIPMSSYSNFLKASRSWTDNMPKETIEVPGKIWGKNTISNPAFVDYQKNHLQPDVNDFLDSNLTKSQADVVASAPAAAAPAEVAPEIPNPFGGSGVFNLDNFPGGRAAADSAVKASNEAWIARHPASQGGIYISDSPELSNQTRAEADAMWNAKFAPRMKPPAAATAADASSSYDVPQGAPVANVAPVAPQFKKGQRVSQGGIVYEFDGEKMIPVK